jgi:hypothetical protein
VDQATGARDQDPSLRPTCRSNDGRNPVAYYVGRDANRDEINAGYDPRYGKVIPFGFSANGEALEPGEICQRCPFSQFITVNGKLMPPTCKESFNFIVYLPGQTDLDGNWMEPRLATLSGNNISLTQALKGRAPGANMGHSDPQKALVGIMKFRDSRKLEKPVALEDVTEDLLPLIICVSETDAAADKGRKRGTQDITRGKIKTYADLEDVLNLVQSRITPKFVWIEIDQYTWAPRGLPNVVPGAEVYPLSMTIAENNATPAQKIPYITTGPSLGAFWHEALTDDEFFEFAKAQNQANEYRAKWVDQIAENQTAVAAKLADVLNPREADIQVDAPQLYAENIEEGNYTPIDE